MLSAQDERVYLTARRHGIVLARPLVRSAMLFALGVALFRLPGVFAGAIGALLVTAASLFVLRAVWMWERTRLVVTDQKVYVVRGTLHRRSKAVRLGAVDAVEVDQSLLGQLFGYGTVVVGPLTVGHVPEPRQVSSLVERLGA